MSTYTTAAMAATTTMRSVCHKCGIIAKSRKLSCCARSGAWFRNCGRAGNTKLGHTWFEGIQTCKTLAQSKTASIDRKASAVQQRKSFDESGAKISKAAITPTNAFTLTSTNTPILLPVRMIRAASGNESINQSPSTSDTIIVTSTRISMDDNLASVSRSAPIHARPLITQVFLSITVSFL